jgi:hypothetical protein
MDTTCMRFDPSAFRQLYPTVRLTSLAEVVGRDYHPRQRDEAASGVPARVH